MAHDINFLTNPALLKRGGGGEGGVPAFFWQKALSPMEKIFPNFLSTLYVCLNLLLLAVLELLALI